jgi:hypothetical protein
MTNTEKAPYLFIFHNPVSGPDPTPEEMQQIFGKWMAWVKSLKDKGIYVGGDRLNDAGKVVRKSKEISVTDGPYAETKETIGGYVIVTAGSLAEAAEIAKGCPGLDYETLVEVRPIEGLPPI